MDKSCSPMSTPKKKVSCFIKVLPRTTDQNFEINLTDTNYEITNRAVETNLIKEKSSYHLLFSPSSKNSSYSVAPTHSLIFKTFWTPDIKISEPGSVVWTAEIKLVEFSLIQQQSARLDSHTAFRKLSFKVRLSCCEPSWLNPHSQ